VKVCPPVGTKLGAKIENWKKKEKKTALVGGHGAHNKIERNTSENNPRGRDNTENWKKIGEAKEEKNLKRTTVKKKKQRGGFGSKEKKNFPRKNEARKGPKLKCSKKGKVKMVGKIKVMEREGVGEKNLGNSFCKLVAKCRTPGGKRGGGDFGGVQKK